MPAVHARQQEVVVVDDSNNWWYSPAAFIVKWAIFASLLVAFFLGILAYQHARRRTRNGQPPMKYHRWMLSALQRAPFEPHLRNQSSFYRIPENGGHAAEAFAPPSYDSKQSPLPMYSGARTTSTPEYELSRPGAPQDIPSFEIPTKVPLPPRAAKKSWVNRINPLKR